MNIKKLKQENNLYSISEILNYFPVQCPFCGWRGLSNGTLKSKELKSTHAGLFCPRCEEIEVVYKD